MPTSAAGSGARRRGHGRRRRLFGLAVHRRAGAGTGDRQPAGPYDFRGYRCRTYCVATNKPGFLPYRGVARTGVCFAMELMIDAIARAVGREPWEVRHENLVPAPAMPYDNVTRKHYDSGDYQQGLMLARDKIDLDGLARAPAPRRA